MKMPKIIEKLQCDTKTIIHKSKVNFNFCNAHAFFEENNGEFDVDKNINFKIRTIKNTCI